MQMLTAMSVDSCSGVTDGQKWCRKDEHEIHYFCQLHCTRYAETGSHKFVFNCIVFWFLLNSVIYCCAEATHIYKTCKKERKNIKTQSEKVIQAARTVLSTKCFHIQFLISATEILRKEGMAYFDILSY